MLHFQLPASEADVIYLNHCARIRDITVSRLLLKVFSMVCKDQLCGAILDDDGKKQTYVKEKHQHRYRSYNGRDYPL